MLVGIGGPDFGRTPSPTGVVADDDLQRALSCRVFERRALREEGLRQRLRRGIAEGDLPASADVSALVSFYTSILDGMAIRARDAASRKALDDIVAMAAWDSVIHSHKDL